MELGVPLTHPNKSHRKRVSLPKKSALLAEFMGIMLGDGGINNDWQANITLNANADAAYAVKIVAMIRELFDVEPAVRKRKDRNTLVISISSTTVVDYLVSLGLVRGNKIQGKARIPAWIERNKSYRTTCVRGLVDTDGCLYTHVHKVAGKQYKNIGLCFSNHAEGLIDGVASAFEQFGIVPHISNTGTRIYLYSEEAVARYLSVFGTSNPRIQNVYQTWKRG